jgi:outer membrane protein insertion porin family
VTSKLCRRRRLGWWVALAASGALAWGTAGARDADVQRIEGIEFRGNESISSGSLRNAMRLKQGVWWNPFRAQNYLGSDYLAVDLYRVLDLYRDRGFPLASIRDAAVAVSESGQDVVIRIEVSEGPRYHIRRVALEGVQGLKPEAAQQKVSVVKGQVLSLSRIEATRGALEALYGEAGFLSAVIRSDLVLRGDSADVLFRVREGPLYRYRSTILDTVGASLQRTDPEVVRREVIMKPGDTMRSSRMLKTQEKIFETGVFRTVRVLPAVDPTGAPLADLRITVHERRSGWYSVGAGYSSDDRVHLVAEWGDRNISGRARRLDAHGDLALSMNRHYGRHPLPVQTAMTELRYTEPWLFGTRIVNQFGISHFYEQQTTFDQDITTLEQGARRSIGRYTSIGQGISNKWVRTGDPTSGRANYLTRNFSVFLEEERRDNVLDAKRGSTKQLIGEYAGGFLGGSAEFGRANAIGSWFYPLAGGVVRAFRLRTGFIFPVGRGIGQTGEVPKVYRIPSIERFRLGGGTSVRGYGENSLGPRGEGGQVIGGTAVFLGNVELRFPIFSFLSGAIFLDAGNVWTDPSEIKLSRFVGSFRGGPQDPLDVCYGAGGGFRFLTPVGPFRVDYGVKLGNAQQAGRKPGALYLSLGQAF